MNPDRLLGLALCLLSAALVVWGVVEIVALIGAIQ